jgi:acetyl-CoA synthetase
MMQAVVEHHEVGPTANLADLMLDSHVRAGRGDAVAIRFVARDSSTTEFTYAQLVEASSRFAGVLRNLGVMPGEVVFSLLGRVLECYLAALGAVRARTILCPLFSAFGPEPIRQRMELGHAAVLVTTSALYRRKVLPIVDGLPDLRHVLLTDVAGHAELLGDGPGGHRVHALGTLMGAAPARFDVEATSPDEPALLHFTSGTTGMPKGALHVHAAGAAHRDSARLVFGLNRGDVYWCTADPGWVTGTSYGIVAPLACGAQMVVDEAEFDAERWYRTLQDHRVEVWYTAPTAIRMMMRAGDHLAVEHDLSALRLAASVGEPLDAEAVVWGQRVLGVAIHDTWWQTETGSIMIAITPETELRPGSMGRPLPWIEAAVLRCDDEGTVSRDADGHPMLVDDPQMPGMVALRSGWVSMFRAYLGDLDRYRACFVDDWYLTGDLARRDGDGYFWFLGRADDVIKTAGHLIGPFEVEQVLMEHDSVVQAGVYGVPDETAGAVIHARVVLGHGMTETEEVLSELMAHARRRLGPAVAPRQIRVVDDLPVTRSGKVMRRVLRARELGLAVGDLSTLEPAAPASQQAES